TAQRWVCTNKSEPHCLVDAERSRAQQSRSGYERPPPIPNPMAIGDTATPGAAAAAKLSISGAALAALLHRCAAAAADCDGLLYGRAAHVPAPPAALSDYDDRAAAPPAPALSISVSGHCSLSHPSSLSDPLGHFNPPADLDSSPSAAVGFFSSRRRTPLRPSMRELALARSLSATLAACATHPLLFILVSPSASPNLSTHSYDYRAFLLLGDRLVPASIGVVNVGPGFRDQYHAFSAESPMPWLPAAPAPGHAHSIGEQKAVDEMVDGFGVGRLQGVLGSAVGQAAEMDGMYAGMLRKLEKLAREVETSNRRVLEQENRNLLLRFRYAGMEGYCLNAVLYRSSIRYQRVPSSGADSVHWTRLWCVGQSERSCVCVEGARRLGMAEQCCVYVRRDEISETVWIAGALEWEQVRLAELQLTVGQKKVHAKMLKIADVCEERRLWI
ncbi:hypothetical protein U9M48_005664, partial [Paspalum notatum var. saurae]